MDDQLAAVTQRVDGLVNTVGGLSMVAGEANRAVMEIVKEGIPRRVDSLEENLKALPKIEKESAVQLQMLTQLTASRNEDNTRAREIIRTVTTLISVVIALIMMLWNLLK
jgi:phage-related minor tail protein